MEKVIRTEASSNELYNSYMADMTLYTTYTKQNSKLDFKLFWDQDIS